MTNSIFLSASIPKPGRGHFFETADPYLIQSAVRELLLVSLGRRHIVWGGHPSITPMVWAMCEVLGVQYARAVTLYQSRFFKERFPKENLKFGNVIYTEESCDQTESLYLMRRRMFQEQRPGVAVFIGGMEGILDEYALFKELLPRSRVITVAAAGGAARDLAVQLNHPVDNFSTNLDFATYFYEHLGIDPSEERGASSVPGDESGK